MFPTIDELIRMGEKSLVEIENKEAKEAQVEQIQEQTKQQRFIELLCELLPEAVRSCVKFHSWQAGKGVAQVEIEGLAPIRVYCWVDLRFPEEAQIGLYNRHPGAYSLVSYRVGFDEFGNDGYCVMENVEFLNYFSAKEPFERVLAHAWRLGNNKTELQAEAECKNAERAGKPRGEKTKPPTPAELLLDALRDYVHAVMANMYE